MLVVALAAAPVAARSPAREELALDAASPVITVEIDGQPFRLRVDLNQWDSIELNPDAVARLTVPWAAGRHLAVGRTMLWGRTAVAGVRIGGLRRPALLAEHGHVAAADADGLIGPDLLPYRAIRWLRADAPPENGVIVMPLAVADRTGIGSPLPTLGDGMTVRFSLQSGLSSATAAAGAQLAHRFDGHFEGGVRPIPIMMDVSRPARSIAFGQPPRIAGFRFSSLLVRIADFRGDNMLPTEDRPDADIIVSRPDRPQGAEPWVTIARDRLDRCQEILWTSHPRSLTLRCAFDPG